MITFLIKLLSLWAIPNYTFILFSQGNFVNNVIFSHPAPHGDRHASRGPTAWITYLHGSPSAFIFVMSFRIIWSSIEIPAFLLYFYVFCFCLSVPYPHYSHIMSKTQPGFILGVTHTGSLPVYIFSPYHAGSSDSPQYRKSQKNHSPPGTISLLPHEVLPAYD